MIWVPLEVVLKIALSLSPGIDIFYGMTQTHLLIPEIKVSLNRTYSISNMLWFSLSFFFFKCWLQKKMLVAAVNWFPGTSVWVRSKNTGYHLPLLFWFQSHPVLWKVLYRRDDVGSNQRRHYLAGPEKNTQSDLLEMYCFHRIYLSILCCFCN